MTVTDPRPCPDQTAESGLMPNRLGRCPASHTRRREGFCPGIRISLRFPSRREIGACRMVKSYLSRRCQLESIGECLHGEDGGDLLHESSCFAGGGGVRA